MPAIRYSSGLGLYQTPGEGVDLGSTTSVTVGHVIVNTQRVTSDTTITDQSIMLCDASQSDINITLPGTAGAGRVVYVKKIDNSTNSVIVSAGSQTIDDELTQEMTDQHVSMQLVYDGSNWFII